MKRVPCDGGSTAGSVGQIKGPTAGCHGPTCSPCLRLSRAGGLGFNSRSGPTSLVMVSTVSTLPRRMSKKHTRDAVAWICVCVDWLKTKMLPIGVGSSVSTFLKTVTVSLLSLLAPEVEGSSEKYRMMRTDEDLYPFLRRTRGDRIR